MQEITRISAQYFLYWGLTQRTRTLPENTSSIIISKRATASEIEQMLSEHKFYTKVVVNIERRILAGGGEMHYDCKQVLLENGSQQQNLWGAG